MSSNERPSLHSRKEQASIAEKLQIASFVGLYGKPGQRITPDFVPSSEHWIQQATDEPDAAPTEPEVVASK